MKPLPFLLILFSLSAAAQKEFVCHRPSDNLDTIRKLYDIKGKIYEVRFTDTFYYDSIGRWRNKPWKNGTYIFYMDERSYGPRLYYHYIVQYKNGKRHGKDFNFDYEVCDTLLWLYRSYFFVYNNDKFKKMIKLEGETDTFHSLAYYSSNKPYDSYMQPDSIIGYYNATQIREKSYFKGKKRIGTWLAWYYSGKLKRKEVYKNDVLIKREEYPE